MKGEHAQELKLLIETRLAEVYAALLVGDPPKRIRKTFARAAKKVSSEIQAHLKDEAKREQKRKKKELKALKKKQKVKTPRKSKTA
jgi:hypothetical protein